MILSASCSCISKAKLNIIKADIKRSDVKPLIWCDTVIGETLLKSRCRCRCFDLDDYERADDAFCDSSEGEFHSGNYPIETCNRIGGTYLDEWNTEIKPNFKRLNSIKKKYIK